MTIVRWILLIGLAFGFLLMAVANWTPVPFRLPDGEMRSVPLPLLLIGAFLAGWLPTWLYHLGAKASWKRRLGKGTPPVIAAATAPPTSAPVSSL